MHVIIRGFRGAKPPGIAAGAQPPGFAGGPGGAAHPFLQGGLDGARHPNSDDLYFFFVIFCFFENHFFLFGGKIVYMDGCGFIFPK